MAAGIAARAPILLAERAGARRGALSAYAWARAADAYRHDDRITVPLRARIAGERIRIVRAAIDHEMSRARNRGDSVVAGARIARGERGCIHLRLQSHE